MSVSRNYNIVVDAIESERVGQSIDRFAEIEACCFEVGIRYTKQLLRTIMLQNRVLVATRIDTQEILGYLIYQPLKSSAHIISICVHPDYRHQHVGKQLLQELKHISPLVTLETRPYNEPFYRRMGFAAYGIFGYYHSDYYQYARVNEPELVKLPGIPMRSAQTVVVDEDVKINAANFFNPMDDKFESSRLSLLALAERAKASTSIFYGSWLLRLFRSGRKEKAFDAIIRELQALGCDETLNRRLNTEGVLESIIFNALMVRGKGRANRETTSGRALLQLLNSPDFANLKTFISQDGSELTYQSIQQYCALKELKKADDVHAPFSPYRHF